jgi:hypothetical protein
MRTTMHLLKTSLGYSRLKSSTKGAPGRISMRSSMRLWTGYPGSIPGDCWSLWVTFLQQSMKSGTILKS